MSTNIGPLWKNMNAQRRRLASTLQVNDIPTDPGVYAWYHQGNPIYVGKADHLHNRLWKKHLSKGLKLSGSAFRRNVAEHLFGILPKAIKTRQVALTAPQHMAVSQWIQACEVAWITCLLPTDAQSLERDMKKEWRPPLTKQ